jgi:hypothetical protein
LTKQRLRGKRLRILKDGADSVGVRGATIRVYVNIGMFSEYWLTLHNRLIGLVPQQPFEVAYAQKELRLLARYGGTAR